MEAICSSETLVDIYQEHQASQSKGVWGQSVERDRRNLNNEMGRTSSMYVEISSYKILIEKPGLR
jgi:hypothetical protein